MFKDEKGETREAASSNYNGEYVAKPRIWPQILISVFFVVIVAYFLRYNNNKNACNGTNISWISSRICNIEISVENPVE